MKNFLACIFFVFTCLLSFAQQRIHAHNDYEKPEPLINALSYKAFTIEADIYLSGNRILVAHDKKDLPTAKTLDSLYLQPIIKLFKQHKGSISADKNYSPILMVDIKENGDEVITELIKLLSAHRFVFDRSVNKKALQVVISGDRTASSKWSSYPSYILFDGRPYETYDNAALKRVAFISDSYSKYVNAKDSATQLKELVKKVHDMGKLLRLWGTPDDPSSWKRFQQLSIDIINTDRVGECRNYFIKHSQVKAE
jgi:alkaline phosphatase